MNNREKAIQVIRRQTLISDLATAKDVARRLDQAGLLTPDLPEPRIDLDGWQEWGHKHGNKVTLHNGMVTVIIPYDISRDLTLKEARDLAAWLNAAANYTEGKQ